MPRIMDYSFLFQSMFGGTKKGIFGGMKGNLIGSFQLSQINSGSVQAQLKAAGINTNSKQYRAALGVMMQNGNGAMYANIQGIKNLMSQYNADGDYVGPGGIVVPGMLVNGIPESERHQIISVSEDARQKMFDETKRHFLQEYGVANGDTTKRSEVFRAFQLSIPKEDRLKGTWTLGQYERAYRQAFSDAVKAVDPNWELGQPFDRSILDSVTRESVDNALVKSGDKLVLPSRSINISA